MAEEEKEFSRELPLVMNVPDDLPLLFSDHMVVRNQNGMFVLYFFQNRQPVVLTPEEAETVTQIDSRCVAQVLLTPLQMQRVIRAMTTNFERFLKRVESGDVEEDDQEDHNEVTGNE